MGYHNVLIGLPVPIKAVCFHIISVSYRMTVVKSFLCKSFLCHFSGFAPRATMAERGCVGPALGVKLTALATDRAPGQTQEASPAARADL